MTNPFLATFDADAHAAFLDAGMADTGVLRSMIGSAPVDTPCKVYVDREPVVNDLGGVEFLGNQVLIKVLREGIASAPRKGNTITIGAEVFAVDRVVRTDESMWEVLCPA